MRPNPRRLGWLAAAVMFAAAAAPQTLAGDDAMTFAETQAVELISPFIEIGVLSGVPNVGGNVTLATLQGDPGNPNDDNRPLLFGHPSSSTGYVTLQVDGANFTNGIAPFLTRTVDPNTGGGINTTVWESGGVRLTQRVFVAEGLTTGRPDQAAMEYTILNIDTGAHDVALRLLLDMNVGGNDGTPFSVPGTGQVTTEVEVTGVNVPQFYQALDNLANPTIIAQGTLSGSGQTPPDRLIFADWTKIFTNVFTYIPDPAESLTNDSAVAMYWNAVTLQPGESRTIRTDFGLGGVSTSTGPLVIGIAAPSQLDQTGGVYSPNPFTVTGIIQNTQGGAQANGVTARLELPPGLEFDAGETDLRSLGAIPFGDSRIVNWQVRATGTPSGVLTMTMRVTTTNFNPPQQTVDRQIIVPALPGFPLITEMTDIGGGQIRLRWVFTGQEPVLVYAVALFDWATGQERYLDLGGAPGDPWLITPNTETVINVGAGGYYTAFVAAVLAQGPGPTGGAPPSQVIISPGAQALVIFQPGTPVDPPPSPSVAAGGPGEIVVGWGLQRALALVAYTVFDFQQNDFIRRPTHIEEIFIPVEMWPGPQPFGDHPVSAVFGGLAPGEYAVQIYHLGWDGSVSNAEAAAQAAGFADGWFHVVVP